MIQSLLTSGKIHPLFRPSSSLESVSGGTRDWRCNTVLPHHIALVMVNVRDRARSASVEKSPLLLQWINQHRALLAAYWLRIFHLARLVNGVGGCVTHRTLSHSSRETQETPCVFVRHREKTRGQSEDLRVDFQETWSVSDDLSTFLILAVPLSPGHIDWPPGCPYCCLHLSICPLPLSSSMPSCCSSCSRRSVILSSTTWPALSWLMTWMWWMMLVSRRRGPLLLSQSTYLTCVLITARFLSMRYIVVCCSFELRSGLKALIVPVHLCSQADGLCSQLSAKCSLPLDSVTSHISVHLLIHLHFFKQLLMINWWICRANKKEFNPISGYRNSLIKRSYSS